MDPAGPEPEINDYQAGSRPVNRKRDHDRNQQQPCRTASPCPAAPAGQRGRPVLMFLHGFPKPPSSGTNCSTLRRPENGGYRCVAPNLRGYEQSSAAGRPAAYRPKHLVQDIAALIALEGGPLACLVAHDWGGAVAWNLANQRPALTKQAGHHQLAAPGTFLRELQHSPGAAGRPART
jgi:pimeloyl-ACP methyl ester carboxylesterase